MSNTKELKTATESETNSQDMNVDNNSVPNNEAEVFQLDPDSTDSAFIQLLNTGKYEYYYERGQIIKGKVIEYDKDSILIDIGTKCEAVLPYKEVADYAINNIEEVLPIGSEYEFFILRDEAGGARDQSKIIVSYKRVAQARIWTSLEEVRDNNAICEAKIVDVVKGGVVVEIDGLRGFIPASHLRVKGGSNNPQLIGESIPCTILELDKQANKLIFSQKLAISQLYAGEREELMCELVKKLNDYEQRLEAGETPEKITVVGEVVRITDFGAFIKILDTEMDGLLPLSEISWKRINDPNELLKVEDELKVQVLNVVPEQSRISLSLKRLTPDPWDEVSQEVNVGSLCDIQILRHNNFGAFVTTKIGKYNLEDMGFEAFLAYSDMKSPNEYMSQDEIIKNYELDNSYKAVLKSIKVEERKLSFSTKALTDDGFVDMSVLNKEQDQDNTHQKETN